MQIQTRAVELSSGAEVLAHARAVTARRKLWWPAPPLPPPSPAPIPRPPVIARPSLEYIDDEAYAEMLQGWVAAAQRDSLPSGKIVCKIVAKHFGITYAELTGRSRRQVFVFPRHVAMYICIHELGYSFPQTALVVKRIDHTTVLAAVRKMTARIAADAVLAAEINDLIAQWSGTQS